VYIVSAQAGEVNFLVPNLYPFGFERTIQDKQSFLEMGIKAGIIIKRVITSIDDMKWRGLVQP
jgi:hypothetical protein